MPSTTFLHIFSINRCRFTMRVDDFIITTNKYNSVANKTTTLSDTSMSVLVIVEPKCMLIASHTAPRESR